MTDTAPLLAALARDQQATTGTLNDVLDTLEKQTDALGQILKLLRQPAPSGEGGPIERLVTAVEGLSQSIVGQTEQIEQLRASQELFQVALAQQVATAVRRGIELAVGASEAAGG